MATMMRQAPATGFFGARAPAAKAPVVAVKSRQTVAVKALFGLGGNKAASGGAAPTPFYICIDCGYIYEGDFKTAPASYKCPVCSAPKNRFKVYKGTDVKGRPNNAQSAMTKRKQAKQW